jgi:hypothetical protein
MATSVKIKAANLYTTAFIIDLSKLLYSYTISAKKKQKKKKLNAGQPGNIK